MRGSLDGFAWGRAATAWRPWLKVLHVTGYANYLGTRPPAVDRNAVIAKPYNKEQLRVRIAAQLGSWAVDRNATLRRLYRYWLAQRGERPWPGRRAIDPTGIPGIPPHPG